MNDFSIIKATEEDANRVWELLQLGILKRKEEGSTQWQNGYPNLEVVLNDIANGYGYTIRDSNKNIVAYVAIMSDPEPSYEIIDGAWLSNFPCYVVHRLIVDLENPIKGLATWVMKKVEFLAKQNQIQSIKVDTNFDNYPMLKIFEKLNYQYCGNIFINGAERKAFEKLLK